MPDDLAWNGKARPTLKGAGLALEVGQAKSFYLLDSSGSRSAGSIVSCV